MSLYRTSAVAVRRAGPSNYFTRLRCLHSTPTLDQNAGMRAESPSHPTKRRLRLSKMYLPTMKDTPTFAIESESHALMLRAGLIRQSSAGVHSFLPFGLRSLQKLEQIIDEEMEGIGAQKVAMPNVLPIEAWQKTGRWESTGQELYRLKDRKGTPFLLAPTHEEEITQLVASDVVSTRQLPVRLYQIGKKFRDEARPRAGLLRGKEFVMKDLYTFDVNEEDALATYDAVNEAYRRMFERIGLPFAVAEADTGNIGGTRSHEYHFVSSAGEDKLLTCRSCSYTANEERAKSRPLLNARGREGEDLRDILEIAQNPAPNGSSGKMAELYPGSQLKAYVFRHGDVSVVVVNTASRRTNDVKAGKLLAEAAAGARGKVAFILDSATAEALPAVKSKLEAATSGSLVVDDVMVAEEGDACPSCSDGKLEKLQAIEVGHAFYLGHRYSLPLAAVYKAAEGEKQTMVPFSMGCFGIGVSRVLGAVVQISHDKDGIVWPESLSPYRVCIIPTFNMKRRGEEEKPILEAAERVYDSLEALVPAGSSRIGEIVIDDRWDMTFGQRIRDAMLVGYPHIVVLGKGVLKDGTADLIQRAGDQKRTMALDALSGYFSEHWRHSKM